MTSATRHAAAQYALLALAFLALTALSFLAATASGGVAVFWPAAGITVVAVLLAPPAHRPWVLAAVGAAYGATALAGGLPLSAASALGVVNVAEAAVVVFALRGVDLRDGVVEMRGWYRLVAAVAAGTGIAALGTGSIVSLTWGGDLLQQVLTWWLADSLGMLVVIPAMLGLHPSTRAIVRTGAWTTELLAVTAVLVGVLGFVSLARGHQLPLSLLALPPLLWPALRLGPQATAWLAGLAVLGTAPLNLSDAGPFRDLGLVERGEAQQVLGLGMVLTAMTLAVAVEQTRRAAAQLAHSEQIFRHSFDDALLGMLLLEFDPRTTLAVITETNAAARATLRLPSEERIRWDSVLAPVDRVSATTLLEAMAAGRLDSWHGELEHVVEGASIWLEVSLSGMRPTTCPDTRVLTMQIVDVTSRREAQAQLVKMALHDSLTGLPNRAALLEGLQQSLSRGSRCRMLGVLVMDLDDFKTVNDAAGHSVGDDVLQMVATRLQAIIRPGDMLSRLGGDEFALLCHGLHDLGSARRVSDRVLASFAEPFLLGEHVYRIDASIGIAVAVPGVEADVVLRQADAAMYAAKRKGKGRAEVFDPEMHVQAKRHAQLTARLYDALRDREFRLHFQPVVDLGTSRPIGVEALIRWQHPDRGIMPPAEWLDVAEQSDLVVELGRWVLDEACRWTSVWQETLGDAAPVVHINVSARHMIHPSFVRDVRQALRKSGASPRRVVLELTETHLLTIGAPVRRHLAELRELGIRLAADDYGTGYSPLSHVTELDVDILKIDKSFVLAMTTDHKAHAVARAVIGLGNSLGLEVVAEGVETPAISAELLRLGCISGQGYLWSAARPAEQIEDLMRGQRPLNGDWAASAAGSDAPGPPSGGATGSPADADAGPSVG